MSKASAKNETSGYPEYGVNSEIIRGFFDPPMASSTFYDLVNKGKITPLPGIRGFYKLNDSLRRLGLREVQKPPKDVPKRSTQDIIRLAFHLIDPGLFTAPIWFGKTEMIEIADFHHAELIVAQHSANLAGLEGEGDRSKVHYLQGVLDISEIMEMDLQATDG
jgi:hypothetical protein